MTHARRRPRRGPGLAGRALGPRRRPARVAPPARRQRLGHADVADRVVRARACRAGPTPSWPRSSPPPAPSARPLGGGMTLAAPTILAHGSDDLKRRLLPRAITGEDTWCQLFSEPGSGSDLAGLTTRAERDGDEWVVNGQKLWNTSAHHADYGMLARPHRLGRAQAPRHHLLRAADAPARRRGPPAAPDERPRLVQRGVPHRRPGAGGQRRRRAGRRLGRRHDDAGPRAHVRHDAPAVVRRRRRAGRAGGGGRGRGVLRHVRVVPAAGRAGRPRAPRSPSSPGRRDDPRRPRSASPGCVALAAGPRVDGPPGPGGAGRRPAAGVRGLARQAGGQRGRPHRRPGPTACSPAPRGCSAGPTACSTASSPRCWSRCRRSRSPAAPTRSSTTSSARRSSACRGSRPSTATCRSATIPR